MTSRSRTPVKSGPFDALKLWGVGYVVAGIALAVTSAWPIYETPRLVVLAFAVVTFSFFLVMISRRFKWRFWLTAAIAVVIYLVSVVPLAIPGSLGSPRALLAGLREGLLGVVTGWKQILTLNLPLGSYEAVLVPFFVFLFASALVSFYWVSRGGRFVLGVVPVVFAMSAFGIVFGSSAHSDVVHVLGVTVPISRPVLLGLFLIITALIFLVGRTRLIRILALRSAAHAGLLQQGKESFRFAARRRALAATLALVSVAVGVSLAPLSDLVQPRQALRDSVNPPVVIRTQVSPLSDYRKWFEADRYSSPIFTLTGQTKGIDSIRIATLDAYDGQKFDVGGLGSEPAQRYSRLPQTSRSAKSNAAREHEAAVTITIGAGYSGVWVPTPGALGAAPIFVGARADQLAEGFYSRSTDASAIDIAPTSAGAGGGPLNMIGLLPGDSYTVLAPVANGSEVTQRANAVAIGGVGAAGRVGKATISASDFPQLAAWVTMQKVPRTAQGFLDLIKHLRARGYVSHSVGDDASAGSWITALSQQAPYVFQASYSGHSRARIESLFASLNDQQRTAASDATDAVLVSGVGDDEQFAAAAALLARYLGLESRVVVGVRLTGSKADSAVPYCTTVCTGANVSAWVEFRGSGVNWVSANTSPQFVTPIVAISTGEKSPDVPTVPDQQPNNELDPPGASRDSSDALAPSADHRSAELQTWLPAIRATLLSLAIAALLLLPLLAVAQLKRSRRRRRRNAPVPEVSIVGAWHELLDTYADVGMKFSSAATRVELALSIDRPAALSLAYVIDRSVFAEHPSDHRAREQSWQLVDAERLYLRRNSTVLQRLKSGLRLTSFLRHIPALPVRKKP